MLNRRSLLGVLLLVLAGPANADGHVVEYPQGYRNWVHVKSMIIEPGHGLYETFGGIHHLYANSQAMTGYRTGTFPDDAVIVFDLLEANKVDGAVVEGARKVVGVMQKDRRRFAATGGWGFEGFGQGDPDQRVVGDKADTACFQCHTAQRDQGYVFSGYRD